MICLLVAYMVLGGPLTVIAAMLITAFIMAILKAYHD